MMVLKSGVKLKLIGIIAVIFTLTAWSIVPQIESSAVASSDPEKNIGRNIMPSSFADLAEKLMPAVVNINTTRKVKVGGSNPFGQELPNGFSGRDDFFKRFFGNVPEREYKQNNLGSGLIISKDGYIFTNNHVIDKVDKIKVKLSDGKEFDATVVGADQNTDLALIKINPQSELPFVTLGDSDSLRVGDWVVAIGNPFGLERTITAGIVSAKGRVIGAGPYDNFIQTDASINPGNSGGPLFNLAGEVVGINTAIIAQGQGIGFAVPVNTAKAILNDLKTKGKVTRGWLGISVQDITEDIAGNLNLKDQKGALVGDVFPGDPAAVAGIKTGDVLVEIDGKKVNDTHDLLRIVAVLPVGKAIDIKAIRDGAVKTFKVITGERKEKKEIGQKPDKADEYYGLSVQELTPEIAQHMGITEKSGVIVKDVSGAAEEAGVRSGDIIVQINKFRISSLKEYTETMAKLDKTSSVLLLIKRGSSSLFVTLKKD